MAIPRENVANRLRGGSVSVLSFYFIQMAPRLTTKFYSLSQVFNYRLSRCRRLIDNALGILVATWRIFSGKIALEREKAKLIVLACCTLHNYLRAGRQPPQGYPLLEIVGRAEQGGMDLIRSTGIRTGTNAVQIRDSFKHYVNVIALLPWQTDVV